MVVGGEELVAVRLDVRPQRVGTQATGRVPKPNDGKGVGVILQPENRAAIEKTVVQSARGDKTAGTDYKVDISDIKLYVSTVESSRVDDLDYYIDLKEMDCAVAKVQSASWSHISLSLTPV